MLLRIILYVLGKKFYIIELGHIILTRGIFAFKKKMQYVSNRENICIRLLPLYFRSYIFRNTIETYAYV